MGVRYRLTNPNKWRFTVCFGFANAHHSAHTHEPLPLAGWPTPPAPGRRWAGTGGRHQVCPPEISDFSVSYGSLFGFRFRRFFFVECDLRLFWGSSELRKSD